MDDIISPFDRPLTHESFFHIVYFTLFNLGVLLGRRDARWIDQHTHGRAQAWNKSATVNATDHNNTNAAGLLTLTPSSSSSSTFAADDSIWWVIVAPVLIAFGLILFCRLLYSFHQCVCLISNWCDWFMALHIETNEGKKMLTERRIHVTGKSSVEIVRSLIIFIFFFYILYLPGKKNSTLRRIFWWFRKY